MASSGDLPLRVFLSYSHDSEEYMKRVLEIANRLREDRFDASIDQYETSPAEGWPTWMTKQVSISRFVLVCCTETYLRRLSGEEIPGKGLGAIWEGLHITQEMYDSFGRNEKFIPVIFSAEDRKHIPVFLRGATFYNLSLNDEYLRLVRHLMGQPPALKPPLGKVRVERAPEERTKVSTVVSVVPETEIETANLVLLIADTQVGSGIAVPASRIDVGPEKVRLTLNATDPAATALLTSLQQSRGSIAAVAFKLTALEGRILECDRTLIDGNEEWTLTVTPVRRDLGIASEMSFGPLSADQIAEIRARLVLLAEPVRNDSSSSDPMNRAMLSAIVSGIGTPLQVRASPFPSLLRSLPDSPGRALALGKLFSVALLVLTNTVEHVLKFDLDLANGELKVDFSGRRPQRYVNADPPIISIAGKCDLSAE